MSDDPHRPRSRPTDERSPDVEVWFAPASVDTPGPTETFCERLLLSDELDRAARFRVASARHQHVIGRGMARALLSAGCCETHEIGFRLLDHGKPIVDSPSIARRAFNVAHTQGLVVCGLGRRHHWLGVDVEWLERRTDPAIAHRYFAPLEIKQLEQTRDDLEQRELFLKLWTLKEAFIKAIGTGLYTPLDQFAFADAATDRPRLVLHNPELARGRTWRFESFIPRPGFVAAIAIGTDAKGDDHEPATPVRLTDFQHWLAVQSAATDCFANRRSTT